MTVASVNNSPCCDIAAIITAYRRVDQTLATLRRIRACTPSPREILVHIDDNQPQCEAAIRSAFPDIRIFRSESRVGPGGGRNKLLAEAESEFVASFDDDSYPIDLCYFERVLLLFEHFPRASIICASLYHQGEAVARDERTAEWVADFAGGACAYRRTRFLATGGYIPLPIAYGMEEVDVALRLRAEGCWILKTPWLRVFHDTNLKRHAEPEVTAGSIMNQGLLAYLRYPASFWPVGLAQYANRVFWLLRHTRFSGVVRGLLGSPRHLWRYRNYRSPVSASALKAYLKLRRNPERASSWPPEARTEFHRQLRKIEPQDVREVKSVPASLER